MPTKTARTYYVYLLECMDGSVYTGITTDVGRRVQEHTKGKQGANYTRAKKPKQVIYTEEHPNRSEASKREAEIKRMPRAKKLLLAAGK